MRIFTQLALALEIHSVSRGDFSHQIMFNFGHNNKLLSTFENRFAALKFAFVIVMIHNRALWRFFPSTKYKPMEKLGQKLSRAS